MAKAEIRIAEADIVTWLRNSNKDENYIAKRIKNLIK